jgi:glycerol uptake facilitator-like aquaporin
MNALGTTKVFANPTHSTIKLARGEINGLISPVTMSPHLQDQGINTLADSSGRFNIYNFVRTQFLAVLLGEFFASWFAGVVILMTAALSGATVGIAYNATTLGMGVGLGVFIAISIFGHISGGHANPALTLLLDTMHMLHYMWEGQWLLLATRTILLLTAWTAQLAGWIVAAACVYYAVNEGTTNTNIGQPNILSAGINGDDRDFNRAFFSEWLASTIFYSVFAFGVVDRKSKIAAIEMGLTVAALTMAFAAQTAAVMNPMRFVGTAIVVAQWGRNWTVFVFPPLLAVFTVVILVEIWRRFIEPVKYSEKNASVMSAPQFPPHNKYVEDEKERVKPDDFDNQESFALRSRIRRSARHAR